eukprot:1331068-Rhodomonas_salina.1
MDVAWAMVRLLRECPLLQFFNIGGNAVGSRALEALVSISPGKTMVAVVHGASKESLCYKLDLLSSRDWVCL